MTQKLLAAPGFLAGFATRQPRIAIGASGLIGLMLVQSAAALLLHHPL